MACLEFTITPFEPGTMTVTPTGPAEMFIEPAAPAGLSVEPAEGAALTVTPAEDAALTVTPVEDAILDIGEVCSVSGGTIVVLAAADGPLRTKNGGYLLLNPATNPPEN